MSTATRELRNVLRKSTPNIPSSSLDYGSVLDGDHDMSTPRAHDHSHPHTRRKSSASSLTITPNLYGSTADATFDETTSLLHGLAAPQKITPLPWGQVLIVLFLQVCEPLTNMSIYPYINQLVGGLDIIDDGNYQQVGYYAGLILSLCFATEAITVLHWSRLSDHVGRKPILLIGLFGSTMSTICFGLSRSFWTLLMSRGLCGLLNGNVGVMKSVMGELTDTSNRAKGFSLIPMVWVTGTTIGCLIGGTLAQPAERFPDVFTGTFWKQYPYFLPCLVTAAFVFTAFLIALVFFKETVPKRTLRPSASNETLHSASTKTQPVPLRQLLIYPVILSIANYTTLSFLYISLEALIPLFFAMPLRVGGLGFDPHTIGYIMGSCGFFTGSFQALFFPTLVRIAGVRRMFVIGIAAYLPIVALFPIISLNAQEAGVNAFTWTCIAGMLAMMPFTDMSFGCISMYITASAPNKRSLGATNGLSQTTVSVARAVAPTMTTSLFAFSVEHKILGGDGVYAILFVFSCFAVYLALCLPHKMWEEAEEDD